MKRSISILGQATVIILLILGGCVSVDPIWEAPVQAPPPPTLVK